VKAVTVCTAHHRQCARDSASFRKDSLMRLKASMLDNFSSDLHRVKSFSVLVYLEFNNLGRVIFKVWHLTFQPTTQTLVHH